MQQVRLTRISAAVPTGGDEHSLRKNKALRRIDYQNLLKIIVKATVYNAQAGTKP
jgi:hypothetical protein